MMILIASLFAAGALAIASGVSSKSPRDEHAAAQIIREGSFELDTTPDKALQFFTPEGERAWVDGWDPKSVYPAQKAVTFQTNAVFRLDDGEEHAIWTILEANAEEHIAEYVYVVQGERLSRVRVRIEPLAGSRCRVHVRYVHTAISDKGLRFTASVTEEAFARKMADWRRRVSAVIR
jgi:hypothetical protein